MKRSILILAIVSLLSLLVGCSDASEDDTTNNDLIDAGAEVSGPAEVELSYNFNDGKQGWEADVTDYPAGAREGIGFVEQVRPLPAEVSETDKAYYFEGQNSVSDIFMFMRRQVGPDAGLEPETAYRVKYTLTFASNYPEDCAEEKGQLMFLKMGASTYKPANVESDDKSSFKFNMQKGDGEMGGEDASAAGDLTHNEECAIIYDRYTTLTREHTHSASVETDANGNLWLIVGVDADYQGEVSYYFNQVDVTLTPQVD
ncbi:hypothetical protein FIV42_24540 [Persicimonas caeni]|uniref:Lipoprotein n=1 Tax=Persicimonas caeni TaxID=2292766 RepID=A0A4Y6Q1D9_PERCE|nr:hypothetical protein [Persicimonas caeni]QDG53795.1 hypothetical protein FIV42_24540 [Persicimonas caeni]QED35016.1 hypothetical protein FRD00_24535 [Persicimonas caeni]